MLENLSVADGKSAENDIQPLSKSPQQSQKDI